MNWLLRSLFVLRRRARLSQAGFVLPTVVMVTLVVTLLVTAIVFRSFDRAKNASNVRVDERVLAVTQPAIDRANAKIKALLGDPALPRGTPTDQALYQAMTGGLSKYTLGDETPLKLVEGTDSLTTAWRFPIDTDNNGKFDSYNLYGVYFRNPTLGTRARSPLEARSEPMDEAEANPGCGTGTAAALVGTSGWYKASSGNLKKSFFVFSATVPISDSDPNLGTPTYERYTGNKGFAAVEFQQDQTRIPLTNNAVVYQDDLEITPGAGIRLNGRVITNSNLLISQPSDPVQFYQVSSINSCFYNAENGKIAVGGNVVVGSIDPTVAQRPVSVDLFRVGVQPDTVDFTTANASVTDTPDIVSYNNRAYENRIQDLVAQATTNAQFPQEVQEEVTGQLGIPTSSFDPNDPLQASLIPGYLEDYFEARTRRVPYAEVANPDDPPGTAQVQGTVAGNDIRPQDAWIYPDTNGLTLAPNQPPATDPATDSPDELQLGDRILVGNGLPAKWWDGEKFISFEEQVTQDVPGGTWTPNTGKTRTRTTQVVPLADLDKTGRDEYWEQKAAEAPNDALGDAFGGLRVVTGAGIYNPAPKYSGLPRPSATFTIADDPSTPENESVLDNATTTALDGFSVVLPDSMPMWFDTDNNGIPQLPSISLDRAGSLVMRATAVYHYRASSYDPDTPTTYQKPIACVSSYYDPSTPITARNREQVPALPDISLRSAPTNNRNLNLTTTITPGNAGLSHNGVSYTPKVTAADVKDVKVPNADGLFPDYVAGDENPADSLRSLRSRLYFQANLIFPNGRFANEPLRKALIKLGNKNPLSLADQAALDSTLCAIQIADRTIGDPNDSVVPHGAIYETTFLDARQVKATEKENIFDPANPPTPDYNLDIEERQPLEVRATVIDLDLLRRKEVTGSSVVPGPEYLLPDSGIIYATRDDASPDLSLNPTSPTGATVSMAERKALSPLDFVVDPHRRPHGIMLINGSVLARGGTDPTTAPNDWKRPGTERGLILATNLPAYVKADAKGFNLHQTPNGNPLEEFTEKLPPNWTKANFYEDRTAIEREPDFACRKQQPGLENTCTQGDLWRPATVLADSVTLLSENFRFGFRNEGDYDLRKNVDSLNNNLVFQEFINEEPQQPGYDFDGNGTITSGVSVTLNELNFGDLNGDGDIADALIFPGENEIPATVVRRINGFFDNNFLTSANWMETAGANIGYPKDFDPTTAAPDIEGSSYVNNFVTPIQRRTAFPEYVMEMCRKPLVSECTPDDWVVGYDRNGNNVIKSIDVNSNGVIDPIEEEERVKASELPVGAATTRLGAGTTARFPLAYDANGDGIPSSVELEAQQRYPRRVAFLRNSENRLVLKDTNPGIDTPVVLGINGGTVSYYSYGDSFDPPLPGGGTVTTTAEAPPVGATTPPALWFKTTSTPATPSDPAGRNYGNATNRPLFYQFPLAVTAPGVGTTQQPLLVPVLQLHVPTLALPPGNPGGNRTDFMGENGNARDSGTWMQRPTAAETTFNLIIATGDNPVRKETTTPALPPEFNGGMPNLPIFLENWRGPQNTPGTTARISGSFIQYKRSKYATAPFLHLLSGTANTDFGYVQGYRSPTSQLAADRGRSPFYTPPNRQWGYDVALLTQPPDLFAQQIILPSVGEPNKFYREVGRDDPWVETLLCAKVLDPTSGEYENFALTGTQTPPPTENCQ
mgnify:CR=1 FL=1